MKLEVTGLPEIDRGLRSLEERVDDLRGLWPDVEGLYESWIGEQFATQGAWGGARWAPLSPEYAARKAAHHPGRSLLIADGTLEREAHRPETDRGARMLTLTIDDPIARLHQSGTPDMPARPLIPERLPLAADRELERVGDRYIERSVRSSGL